MLAWLAQWWNWPFEVALLVGAGLALVSLLGHGKSTGDGDAFIVAKDVGFASELDLPNEVGFAKYGFGLLGFGRAPLSVLIEVLLVGFGIGGLLVNAIVRDLLPSQGALAFPIALIVALVVALASVQLVGTVFARLAPANAKTSRASGEFVGSVGVATGRITHHIGQVTVPSAGVAPDALLNAHVDPTWPDDIPRGSEVHLVGYDAAANKYRVVPLLQG